jgi:hypothetical protein
MMRLLLLRTECGQAVCLIFPLQRVYDIVE